MRSGGGVAAGSAELGRTKTCGPSPQLLGQVPAGPGAFVGARQYLMSRRPSAPASVPAASMGGPSIFHGHAHPAPDVKRPGTRGRRGPTARWRPPGGAAAWFRPSPRPAREKGGAGRSSGAETGFCMGNWPARDPILALEPANARFCARPVRRIYKKGEAKTSHSEADKVLLGVRVALGQEQRATIGFAIKAPAAAWASPIKVTARISLVQNLVVTASTGEVARGIDGSGPTGGDAARRKAHSLLKD